MSQICIVSVMAVYLIMMILIGWRSSGSGNSASQADFYLGGRKIGPIVTAMSAEASDMSSYLLMGLPGLAYISGTCDVGWTVIGLAAGTFLNWLFVSKRLRRYSEKLGAITIPDYFSKRFHDERELLSFIAALFILIFFIPYTASGFKAIGTLFNSLFGFDYHISMIVGAAIVILYTVIGGFLAVSTTDLIQGIVMTFSLFVIIFFGITQAGGIGNVLANARELDGYLSMKSTWNITDGTSSPYHLLTAVSTLAWGLGYFGMPHILLRFMAIQDEESLTTSRRIAFIWVVISMGLSVMIGIVGLAVSKAGVIPMLMTNTESETIIIRLANKLAENGITAALIAGITLSGILASTMSTADSQLLQASSSFSKNILQDFFHIRMNNKTAMLCARITVIVIALFAVTLAWEPNNSVFRIVSFAWAGFGAAFGPLILLSLFWKRTNRPGALAGMFTGGIAVFLWKFLIRPMGGYLDIYELLPAFLLSLLSIIIVSLSTEEPSEEILLEFTECRNK